MHGFLAMYGCMPTYGNVFTQPCMLAMCLFMTALLIRILPKDFKILGRHNNNTVKKYFWESDANKSDQKLIVRKGV